MEHPTKAYSYIPIASVPVGMANQALPPLLFSRSSCGWGMMHLLLHVRCISNCMCVGLLQAVQELTGLVESANSLLHGSKGLETQYLQLPSYASQRLSLALEDDPNAGAYMAPLRCLSVRFLQHTPSLLHLHTTESS